MKPSEALRSARALLEVPGVWTSGNPDYATTHCIITAVVHVTDASGESNDILAYLRRAANPVVERFSLVGFNSAHSHQEVLDVFDQAIMLAESEGC